MMIKRNALPTIEILQELVSPDFLSGKLYWNARAVHWFSSPVSCNRWNKKYDGKEAFTHATPKGYRVSTINSVHYLAHRVIWKMFHGVEPPEVIDHIDGNPSNNAVENLQAVTVSQNIQKAKLTRDGKHSQYRGVSFSVRDNRWLAYCHVDGKRLDGGRFADERSAAAAYNDLAATHFGKFAVLNEVNP